VGAAVGGGITAGGHVGPKSTPSFSVSKSKKLRQLRRIFANLQLNKTSDCEVHSVILTFLKYVMFKKSQQFYI
jgi:hypothetical protein